MSEKTKKDKTSTSPTSVDEANPDLSAETTAPTQTLVTTTKDLPATVDADVADEGYMTTFTAAKNQMVSQLRALGQRLVKPEEQADIQKLVNSATPSSRGLEEMDEHWSIPVVRIAQGMTREKPDNARLGDLFTTAGEVVKGSLRATPLYMYELNQMFPEGGKGPMCFSPDAKLGTKFGTCRTCPNLPMGKNASGQSTDCNNGICVIVLTSEMRLYRIEFYKTSRKAGKQFKDYAKQSPNIWDRWYTVGTQETKNDKGQVYHVFKTSSTGEDVPTHIREAADALNAMISAERKAGLKEHYERVAQGGVQASTVDENLNFTNPGAADPEGKPDFTKSV